MKICTLPGKKTLIRGLATSMLALGATHVAAQLDLANQPLYLGSEVDPNILFVIDDSGSMDFVVTLSKAARELHANEDNRNVLDDFIQIEQNRRNRDTNITYSPETPTEAYRLCPGFNVMAFDPAKTYTPWAGYPDITDITQAPRNPVNPNSTTDLTDHAYIEWNDNGDGIYQLGECPTTCTEANKCFIVGSKSDEIQRNYANWYSYYRTRDFVTKKAVLALVDRSNARMGLGTMHDREDVGLPIKDMKAAANKTTLINNVAKITPGSGTPTRASLNRAGEYYRTGSNSLFGGRPTGGTPILSQAEGGQCQKNFTVLMTDGFTNEDDFTISNHDGDDNTDYDGGVFSGSAKNALADVAMKFYENDLSGLPNRVSPTNIEKRFLRDGTDISHQRMITYTAAFGVDGEMSCSPTSLDAGENTCNESWPTSLNFNGSDPKTIDDLRHAAFNGRGEFLNAQTPEKLIKGLSDALETISASSSAAAVAANSTSLVAGSAVYQGLFNSDSWTGDLMAFAINTGTECPDARIGEVCPQALWEAAAILDKQIDDATAVATAAADGQNVPGITDTRTIITSDAGGTGIAFRWPSGTGATATLQQFAALAGPNNLDPAQVVDYVRGDGTLGANFRSRSSIMGDIIHSSPVFVGAPRFSYPDGIETAKYSDFKASQEQRTKMVYVGANDGMLHGFDATTGEEKLAYIPSALFPELPKLADPNYTHQYYVDGAPTVGDVFFSDNSWRTLLVGGLRAGGRSIYALDITNPTAFSEANAAAIARWEFTDPDLGLSYSRPDIVKTNTDKWAVIFGNGYNRVDANGLAADDGNVHLFVVDAETGATIQKVTVVAGAAGVANGLATVTPVDIDGDLKTDYAYAGDLLGNVYRFDLTGATPNAWSGQRIFTAVGPDNIPQKITSRPSVVFHPEGSGGVLVMFGTGSYIETSDNTATGQQTQSFYALWDKAYDGSLPALNRNNADYLRQTIMSETADGLRLTSESTVNWQTQNGWYIDLIVGTGSGNLGERQVSDSVVRGDRVVFITTVPDNTVCASGGSSYLMELATNGGGRPDRAPFDTNNDGKIDDADLINAQSAIVTGTKLEGIVSLPTIVGDSDTTLEHKIFSGSSGSTTSVLERSPTGGGQGSRQSWAERLR